MKHLVSKSSFKAKALQYLRQVESTGKLVITAKGKPVLKIVPYTRDPEKALRALRGSVIRYIEPLEPVWQGNTDLESVALSTDPEFLELIQNSRSRHARHGGLSSAEMRRRLEE